MGVDRYLVLVDTMTVIVSELTDSLTTYERRMMLLVSRNKNAIDAHLNTLLVHRLALVELGILNEIEGGLREVLDICNQHNETMIQVTRLYTDFASKIKNTLEEERLR